MDRIGIIGGTGLVSINLESDYRSELEQLQISVIRSDDCLLYTSDLSLIHI